MKNKKSNSNKNVIILLRFVTSYSILLLIVLIMGLFLYKYGINEAKENLHIQNRSVLDNAVSDLDDSILVMNTLSTQISNDSTLRSLVKFDNTNDVTFHTTALLAMDLLKDFIPSEIFMPVTEYFVYLPKVDYVLSNSMLSEASLYYKHNKAFRKELYQDWQDMIGSTDNLRSFIHIKKYYKSDYNAFLYKVPLTTSILLNRYSGMVCFEINDQALTDMFANLDFFKTGFLLVKDEDNNEVFRITSTNTKEGSPELLLDQVSTHAIDASTNYMETNLNDESVVITVTKSTNTSWTYYLVQPSELVFNKLNSYQNAYSIIIVLSCLFSLITIYILSKRNIQPIIQIKSELETSLVERHSLMQALEYQRPIVYNSCLGRIMRGLITTEEEVNEIKQFLGLQDTNAKYSVLYVSVYENQIELYMEDTPLQQEANDNQSDYRQIIRAYLHQYFGDEILIYEATKNSFAVLLSSDSTISLEEANESFQNIFIKLHNELMEQHSIWIFGGLGNRNFHLPYLWKSYQQAIQAVSYIREGNVFQAFKDIKRDKSSYYYPYEMAQQLSNFITSGNAKQVHEIFTLIRRENFEVVSLPINMVNWLLSDIRNTLLKVRFTIESTDENQNLLESVDAAFQEPKTIDLMQEISLKLTSLHEQKVDGNKLILSIKEYLKENYSDSSLSLKKISELFDISESYFSYLFKAETKQNFSEYLEKIRMEQAMILLKTTDINVSDMYLELGYNNANSFRRAFKKIHGVSPKTIRESLESKDSIS